MNIDIHLSPDHQQALAIALRNPHFFNESGLKEMEKDIAENTLIGAYLDQELCGFVVFKELNPQAVELAWMAVEPKFQGQKIGSQLVEQGLRLLNKNYSVCQMKTLSEIDPDPQYAQTREFYRKLGFIPLETIHPYPGWGEDNPCQIFVKVLTPSV